MQTREARGRSFVPLALAALVAAVVGATLGGQARAQSTDPTAVAARVHAEGGYPDDITVLEDETGGDGTLNGSGGGGGSGPHGTIDPNGDRDGGDPSRGFDIPMPDFIRDLLAALANLIGAAAPTLTYVLFALGLALLAVFVVFLVTLLRFPKRDLLATRGALRLDGSAPLVDPLLDEALASPEEYARQGKFREAIHAVFVRALSETARAGDVDRRGRTAREVVTAIARLEPAPPELVDLLSLAELVWFGGRPATETQYVHAARLASSIRTGAPRSEPLTGAPRPEAP